MAGAGVQVRFRGQKHQTSSVASWNGSATWRRTDRQQFPRQPPVTNILDPVKRWEGGGLFYWSFISPDISLILTPLKNVQTKQSRTENSLKFTFFNIRTRSKTYLLSVAGQVGSRRVWQHGGPLPVPCSQLFPLVRFQAVAEGVANLPILLRLLDVDVALCRGRPGVSEQAAVLLLSALSLREQSETGLTVAEESVWITQSLREKGWCRKTEIKTKKLPIRPKIQPMQCVSTFSAGRWWSLVSDNKPGSSFFLPGRSWRIHLRSDVTTSSSLGTFRASDLRHASNTFTYMKQEKWWILSPSKQTCGKNFMEKKFIAHSAYVSYSQGAN